VAVCRLGPRKLAWLSRKTGLTLVSGVARGGWDHWHRCLAADGTFWDVKSDGTAWTPRTP
jgi:hypothetical protein